MSRKIIIYLIGGILIVPYVYTVFFIRNTSVLLAALVDFCSLILVTITVIIYLVIEDVKKRRLIVVLASIGMILFFVLSYKFQLQTANFVFYKLNNADMNKLVNEIKEYGKIYTMTVVIGGFNQINNTEVEYFENEKRDIVIKRRDVIDINEYLREFDIDTARFGSLKNRLMDLSIYKFEVKDNKIFFLLRYSDTKAGYVFSEDGIKPDEYRGGSTFDCQRVADNWFYFYEN